LAVAAKTPLLSAGPIGGTPGSPTPEGLSVEGTRLDAGSVPVAVAKVSGFSEFATPSIRGSVASLMGAALKQIVRRSGIARSRFDALSNQDRILFPLPKPK
jgi:hypothetical protein